MAALIFATGRPFRVAGLATAVMISAWRKRRALRVVQCHCLSIANCAGNVTAYSEGRVVHMLHRLIAGGAFLCTVVAFGLAWLRLAATRIRTALSAGLIVVHSFVVTSLSTPINTYAVRTDRAAA